MTSLEEIQAKFDFCQEKLANGFYDKIGINETFLTHFSGSLLNYCKLNCPFDIWYESIDGSPLRILNRILIRHEKTPLSEEELRVYYNHTFQNVINNSM